MSVRKRWMRTLTGAMLLCLTTSLVGCANTRLVLPPAWMMADCARPADRDIKSNRDLVRRVDDWADAFDQCNDGRATLRDWAEAAAREANGPF